MYANDHNHAWTASDNIWDEIDQIELGAGVMIGMANENDMGEEHALFVIGVRGTWKPDNWFRG